MSLKPLMTKPSIARPILKDKFWGPASSVLKGKGWEAVRSLRIGEIKTDGHEINVAQAQNVTELKDCY